MTDRRRRRPRKDEDPYNAGNVSGFGGATVGTHTTGNQAIASDRFLEGMSNFLEEYEKRKNVDDGKLKGFLFESIEAAKFNRNAARTGSTVRAEVTGGANGPVDVRIGPKSFQLKAYEDPGQLATLACDPKYDGMDVVVPSNMKDKVNRVLERRGETRRVIGEVKSGGISSGGTTSRELKRATDGPEGYVRIETAKQIGREAIETGMYAAGAAAVIGGGLSAVKNGLGYLDGTVDGREAIANVGKDAVRSGVRSGATGALGVGVRHGAGHIGVPMKSNIAAAVAAAVVEVGVTVYEFARGEISAEKAGERIGETGCLAAGSMYAGAVAGSVFGPPGAVVGSMVGYMATAWVYQGCMAVLKQARLAEEEADRLEALCSEAVQEWNRQQQEFESRMAGFLEERHTAFGRCFGMIDEALEADDTDKAVRSLAQLAAMTGSALKFEGFEEFKEFMEQETDVRWVI